MLDKKGGMRNGRTPSLEAHRLQGCRVECLTVMFLRHPFVTIQVLADQNYGYGIFPKFN